LALARRTVSTALEWNGAAKVSHNFRLRTRKMFEDIGKGRFYLGDCLEIMKEIPDGVIDMVMCDLPYGTTQNKWDSVLPLNDLWEQYWRVCAATVVLTAQPPFDKQLGASCLDAMQYEWIWQKTRATGHLNAKKQPMRAHENILIFYRKFNIYNPQGLLKKDTPTIRKGGNNGTNYGKSDKDAIQEFENYPNSILKIKSEGKGFHPTQKPIALFEYLIKTYTNEGDLVLDNCAGSGTTAIACENTNRRWVCIEKDETYYAKAVQRIKDHVNDNQT
jgi:site-specific DNA-methyltransferase (adenine-specific)